jgi:hypothetical protein
MTIPEEERLAGCRWFVWLPEVADDFAFLERGATMSSDVGYIPTDGGDFLLFLIEVRKIVEAPRDPSLCEIDDAHARAAALQRIPCGYGYSQDAEYNLVKNSRESGRKTYYEILSRAEPEWAFEFVLNELASCSHSGLTVSHIEDLRRQGYGSIVEMIEAPDDVLLALKGIGKKRLEKIRKNRGGRSQY